MRRSTLSVLAPAAAVVLVGLLASAVAPAESDPGKARHRAMEQINDAVKTLAAMAKGEHPFEATAVRAQATIVADRLREASGLFPPGSDTGDTHALPEVWTDREGFDEAMKDAQTAASELRAVEREDALRPALGALGQRCQACHEKYRMPDM